MTRIQPTHPNSGYALDLRSDDEAVEITFLRSVGYDTHTKNTPAFDLRIKKDNLHPVYDAIVRYPDTEFTLFIPVIGWSKTLVSFEHSVNKLRSSKEPRRTYIEVHYLNGSITRSTALKTSEFVELLSGLFAED